MMTYTKLIPLIFVTLVFSANIARAECYYAYKAKKDNPLQLHVGVIEVVGSCAEALNKEALQQRLLGGGWSLLVVLGQVPQNELLTRKEQVGEFFLRY
ncbi:MAG: hypothetical protein ACI9O0_000156 [Paracoccaceae bacterium]|jgi:hypothetical protein